MANDRKLTVGEERPYAVFVVRGVTYSFSAPVVIPVDDEIVYYELADDDCESAPNIADVATSKYRPSIAQWCYSVFASLGAKGAERASRSGWLPLSFDPLPTSPMLGGPAENSRSRGPARRRGRRHIAGKRCPGFGG